MKYDPNATPCLPDGDYEAVIINAEETQSKAGNDMVVITWRVYGNSGDVVELKDYIVDHQPWKLKRIAKAIGRLKQFESGEFRADDYRNQSATLTLVTKEDDYGPKNEVKVYQTLQRTSAARTDGPHSPITESDIPF